MSDTRYDILFNGELLPGFAPETVAENLGKLFKASPETVQKLMGGGEHVLKRGTDRETAQKYELAMQRAGARALLREVPGTPIESAPPASVAATPAAPAAPSPPPALSLAPAGGDLLAEHEREHREALQVDTSHIKLVSTFLAPAEPQSIPPPPPPDTSHISVAAAGADLLPDPRREAPPPAPDTSAISLAPAGETLAPAATPMAVELPDLSAITLAPPGTTLEELKPERTLLNPDTSALALEPLPR